MRIATIQVDGQLQLGFGYQDKLIVPNKGFAESRGMPLSLQEAIELGPKLQDVFATLVEIYERDRNRSQFLSVLDPAAAEHGPAVPWNQKIICVGLNYSDHAAESKLAMADRPIIFSKYDNTLCGHGSVVRRPNATVQMDY